MKITQKDRIHESYTSNRRRQLMKSKECKIEFVDDLDRNFEIKATIFKTEEIKKKHNRAKKKQELERMTRDIAER